MACLYPQTILLDNSLKSNKKLAFAILIGCIDVDLTKNTISNIEWGNINMDFQYNKKNSLNFDFESINYHYTIRDKTYNKSEQILNITKSAIYQSLVFYSYGRNIPLDLYNNPNILIDNGYLNNLEIFQINNLENLVKTKTMQQFDFKQKLVDIDTNYLTKLDYGSILWIEYSLNINLLGATQPDSGIKFLLGWKIQKSEQQPEPEPEVEPEPQPEPEPEPEAMTQIIIKLENIKKDLNVNNNKYIENQENINSLLNSSYTFNKKYEEIVDTITPPDKADFYICGGSQDTLQIIFNNFCVQDNNVPCNIDSLMFKIDTKKPLSIESNSKRAKSYEWVGKYKNIHNFNSFIKGLYGEMLINSQQFPVDRNQSEPLVSYITNESLSKCIDNHEQFFENIVHNIISGLQDYYKKVWNNKDKIQQIITKNKNRFYRQGDIIGIPIDINATCKVKSILDENNNYDVSNKHINDIWKVVMYFFIKN